MIAIRSNTLHGTLGGSRLGTALIEREEIFNLLGMPNEDWREADHLDNKVTLSWYFDTPKGPAQVRDYWWNAKNEWSIAAENIHAARFLARHLRSLGVAASTRFQYAKCCKLFWRQPCLGKTTEQTTDCGTPSAMSPATF